MWKVKNMSEEKMGTKKGKNFKEVIAGEKRKGRTSKKLMKTLTGLNSSIIYGASFLLTFVTADILIYYFLAPAVFIWAGILIAVAVVCSLFASYVTNRLKKQQWKYASY